jgi:hypothetical protein
MAKSRTGWKESIPHDDALAYFGTRGRLVVVVVGEQVPVAVEAQANAVAGTAGHDPEVAAVRPAAEDAADTGVGRPRALRLAEEGPVRPVIGPVEVAIARHRIAHGEIEIALGSPGEAVEALVDAVIRHAPDQPPWPEVLALCRTIGEEVEGAGREDIQVRAADLDVVDPGILREAVEFASRLVAAVVIGFVNEECLPAADEQPAGRVGADRQERLGRRRVDADYLQCRVGEAVIEILGGRAGTANEEEKQADERKRSHGGGSWRKAGVGGQGGVLISSWKRSRARAHNVRSPGWVSWPRRCGGRRQAQDVDGAVAVGRDQMAAVRTEGKLPDFGTGRTESQDPLASRLLVPQPHRTIGSRRSQDLTVRPKCDTKHPPLVPNGSAQVRAGLNIPEFDRLIAARTGQDKAVRPKRHGVDGAFVSGQSVQRAARGPIPQAHHAVAAAGRHSPTVRVHGGSDYPGSVAAQSLNRGRVSRRKVPHLERLVSAGRNQPAAYRIKGNDMDSALVSTQGMMIPGGNVP